MGALDRVELAVVDLLIRCRLRQDRRRVPRIPCKIAVSVYLGDDDPPYRSAQVVDISRLGYRAIVDGEAVARSRTVKVRVESTRQKLPSARVVRATPGVLQCEFMRPLDRATFRTILEKLPT